MSERRTVTKLYAERYQRAVKKEKGVILTEFLRLTNYDRCYGAWLLRQHGRRLTVRAQKVVEGDALKVVKRARPVYYDAAVKKALVKIWSILDGICSKRLVPALPTLIPKLEACGELRLSAKVRAKLLQLSPATVDRLLAPARAALEGGRKIGHTKPGGLLKQQIPIRTFADWNEQEPGFVELDLVGHEGGSARGDFCYTLDVTEVCSGWTETRAIPNKAQVWVVAALEGIRQRAPFTLRGIDSDNGSEFINEQLVRYCQQEQLTFTRSRSGRKNDNCFVEQKNYSVVRRAVGYRRYDTAEQLRLLNELYEQLRLYTNYFQPVMKLREKTRNGSKVSKKYDPAQTPYERLLASNKISAAQKQQLRQEYDRLNPAQLKRDITQFQQRLAKSVNATTGAAKSCAVTTSSPPAPRR